MGAETEVVSMPATPRAASTPPFTVPQSPMKPTAPPSAASSPQTIIQCPISAPPSNFHNSPSMSMSPFLARISSATASRFSFSGNATPVRSSPMRKVIVNMKSYLEEVGHLTRLDPQDAWLPITESRNGNAYYSAFHNLSAGIGFQALILPLAFTFLGWTWGILCLSAIYIWQLYTLWILTQLHESVPGTRYNRYIQLSVAAFGPKLGLCLTKFPTMYLSAGNCTALIIIGGGTMKLFFGVVCGDSCHKMPLSTVEWYLVFLCLALVLAQLPNLNSIAGISLVGAITAVTYCTLIWTISVSRHRPEDISYEPLKGKNDVATIFSILNALGVVAFSFRGHNLVLEIQATMPSTLKHPSNVPMWKGVKAAYLLIALCLFPLAIGGYWAYGNSIPRSGILYALHRFHSHDTSRALLGLTTLMVAINCLSTFQIYAMPVFDNLESSYTFRTNRPCPRWLRSGIRVFFASVAFFIANALPFLTSLAGLLGGISLPVTLAYPCFMYNIIRKPVKYSPIWYLNLGLGGLGMVLSFLFIVGGIWSIVNTCHDFHFFKPQQ
ncbi:unnamed protein product [Victoria cruziana]